MSVASVLPPVPRWKIAAERVRAKMAALRADAEAKKAEQDALRDMQCDGFMPDEPEEEIDEPVEPVEVREKPAEKPEKTRKERQRVKRERKLAKRKEKRIAAAAPPPPVPLLKTEEAELLRGADGDEWIDSQQTAEMLGLKSEPRGKKHGLIRRRVGLVWQYQLASVRMALAAKIDHVLQCEATAWQAGGCQHEDIHQAQGEEWLEVPPPALACRRRHDPPHHLHQRIHAGELHRCQESRGVRQERLGVQPLTPCAGEKQSKKGQIMKKTRRTREHNNPDPENYVSTRIVARRFGMQNLSAIKLLHAHHVRYKAGYPNTFTWYWHKGDVDELYATRPRHVDSLPEGYVDGCEASRILGITRSTLGDRIRRGTMSPGETIILTTAPIGRKKRIIFQRSYILGVKENFKRRKPQRRKLNG